MTIALVQHASLLMGGSNDPETLAFSSNVAAGNLLTCLWAHGNGSGVTVVGITDTVGSTWSVLQVADDGVNGLHIELWYAVAAASGPNTVSVDQSSATPGQLGLMEHTGLTATPLDQSTKKQEPTSVATFLTPDLTPPQATALLIGGIRNAGGRTVTVDTPWGIEEQIDSGRFTMADAIVAVAQAYHYSGTITASAPYAAVFATFLDAPAAGGDILMPQSIF